MKVGAVAVAPLTGAWIETCKWRETSSAEASPLTGAWIETEEPAGAGDPDQVAPLTGAWIETRASPPTPTPPSGRPPHGGVD